MTNKQIQLKTTKINWLDLINMTLDRKDWGKKFNLYIYGDVIINIIMSSFDFKRQIAYFEIECNYTGEYSYSWYNMVTIDYPLLNFKIEDFERLLNIKIFRLIDGLVEKECSEKAKSEYFDIYVSSSDVTDEQIYNSDYSDDYDTAQNLSYEFCEMIIDELKDKVSYELNSEYRCKVNEFKNTYQLEDTKLQIYHNLIKKDYE